jgi:hypothetical protein
MSMRMVPDKYLTQVASNCHWECVTAVSIQVHALFFEWIADSKIVSDHPKITSI